MYSNVFDTVRTDPMELVNTEALLFSSLLNGLHPTFSLNQAVDSKALSTIIQQDENFLKLVRDQHIKVALYSRYPGDEDAITSFLTDRLNDCIDNQKISFTFSSLDFLYNEAYTDAQRIEIYKLMRDIITGNKKGISNFEVRKIGFAANSYDKDLIENHLNAIKKLIQAINLNYVLPPEYKANNDCLYKKLLRSFERCKYETQSTEEKEALDDFKELVKREIKQNQHASLNKRSYLYKLIENLQLGQDIEAKIKSIVDLLYNEVVAESLDDDEESIIIVKDDSIFPDVMSEESNSTDVIDKAEQKLKVIDTATLINLSESTPNILTWDFIHELRTKFKPYENNLEEWSDKINEFCRAERINSFEVRTKKLLCGVLLFAAKAIADYMIISSSDNIGIQVAGPLMTDNIYALLNNKIDHLIDKDPENRKRYIEIQRYINYIALLKK